MLSQRSHGRLWRGSALGARAEQLLGGWPFPLVRKPGAADAQSLCRISL